MIELWRGGLRDKIKDQWKFFSRILIECTFISIAYIRRARSSSLRIWWRVSFVSPWLEPTISLYTSRNTAKPKPHTIVKSANIGIFFQRLQRPDNLLVRRCVEHFSSISSLCISIRLAAFVRFACLRSTYPPETVQNRWSSTRCTSSTCWTMTYRETMRVP